MCIITPYSEVCQLRKSGDYKSAYEKAMQTKMENPTCLWVYNQIGWCLFDMLKANANIQCKDEFLLRLQEFSDINNEHALDGRITSSIVWPIRTFIASCHNENFLAEDLLFRVFGIMQQITFNPADENYGILLGAFIGAKTWGGLKQFIEWWNLDNIKAKDCIPYKTDKGRTLMSTAEQAYIAYAKILLSELENNSANTEQVANYAERLSSVADEHPEFQYPNYFQAKLLLGLGQKEETIKALTPFVKKKPNEYWVWDLLGDASSDDETRISCYCKALICPGKEQYLRRIHLKLCDLLMQQKLYNEAANELKAAITISNNNGWPLPFKYQDYTTEEWYLNSQNSHGNEEFYRNHIAVAEQLLYSDMPEMAILVTRINQERQLASFITSDHKDGFFSCKNTPCEVGSVYLCRLENDRDKHYKVYTIKKVDGRPYGLVKDFAGKISINQAGFGFVEDVFIKTSLASMVVNGEMVTGIALHSFDNKKGTWGWAAFKLIKK